MTNADVQELIDHAKTEFGRTIAAYEALVFLGAQELLNEDSSNVHAAEVVRNFNAYMKSGVKKASMAEFFLPLPETDEENAASNKRRDDYLDKELAR